MQSLSTELRAMIRRHIDTVGPQELSAIVQALTVPAAAPNTIRLMAAGEIILPRFEIVSDEIVYDRKTKLFWTRHFLPGGAMSWKASGEACRALNLGGYTDWRRPPIQELQTIIDYMRFKPAIDTEAFPGVKPGFCWSDTVDASAPHVNAWGVYFYYGYSYLNPQGSGGFALAVRGGQ